MNETAPMPQDPTRGRRHGAGPGTSIVVGIVLIALGIAFFLERAGVVFLTGNWWAIFIYLLAGSSLWNAWRSYQASGEFGSQATGSLVWGLVFAAVATIFVFNLVWDTWWPAILVAVGVGIVVGNLLGSMTRKPPGPSAE